MSRIILNEYTITPQTPTTDTLAIYAQNGELHVLNDVGTDITVKSAQLHRVWVQNIAPGSSYSNNSIVYPQGAGLLVSTQASALLVTANIGFTIQSNAYTSWMGIRVNGVDTWANRYMITSATFVMLLNVTPSTQYEIYLIVRNNSNLNPQFTTGGYLLVEEVST